MTRCYEYYCLFVCTPDRCELGSVRGKRYVERYIRFMQEKGVTFDKAPDDKNLFLQLQEELGTERSVFKGTIVPHEVLPEPPKGLWNVVVMDPPWVHGAEYNPDTRREVPTYSTLTFEEIALDHIPPLTEDGILWLWTINRYLHDAFHLLEHWDLSYKGTFVWVKPTLGMGRIIRHRAEFCLLAFKGEPFWHNTQYHNIIEAPAREHSRKPDAFYDLVDALCTGRKLDYFARESRDGWDTWGAEEAKFDEPEPEGL